jgi:hypothetical protein
MRRHLRDPSAIFVEGFDPNPIYNNKEVSRDADNLVVIARHLGNAAIFGVVDIDPGAFFCNVIPFMYCFDT